MANTTIPFLNLDTTEIQTGTLTATKLSDLSKWMGIPPAYLQQNRDKEIESARIKLKVKEGELKNFMLKRAWFRKYREHLVPALDAIILERKKEITYIYLSYPAELMKEEDE